MDTTVYEDCAYFFVVAGFAPELLRNIARRREKHFDTRGKKIIKCPYCKGDFDSVDTTVKIELYRHNKKANTVYHNISSCKNCCGNRRSGTEDLQHVRHRIRRGSNRWGTGKRKNSNAAQLLEI